MVGPGKHGLPARLLDRLDDFRCIARHQNRPDSRLAGTTPDMDDHRLAMNIGQRLARQAG